MMMVMIDSDDKRSWRGSQMTRVPDLITYWTHWTGVGLSDYRGRL